MENKKENKNRKMTLEKIARMVADGFSEANEKMATKDEMNSRFDSVETKLKSVEKKVDKLDYQVDEVHDILKRFEENDILNLQKRVQILEKAVRALATSSTSK